MSDFTFSTKQNFMNGLRYELRPQRFLSSLMAGLITGVLAIVLSTSIAVLVFSGDLSAFTVDGIRFALFGTFIVSVTVSIFSSIPGLFACIQDNTAAILALLVVSITRTMPAAMPEERFITVMALIVLSSTLTGVFLLILGYFKLGDFIRFIPYPVIGGILASTGLLLAQGALIVMTNSVLDVAVLVKSDILILWLPGVVFAVSVLIASRRYSHFLLIPTFITVAILLFYIWMAISGLTIESATEKGLLLGAMSQESTWKPLDYGKLLQVDWSLILGQAGGLLTIILVSSISLLLNATSFELITQQDASLNRELRSAGLANLIAGISGSLVGYHVLSISILGYRIMPSSRLVGIITGMLCLVVLFFGGSILAIIPKPVLGGLLLYLGLDFLAEWLYDGWFKLLHSDYLIILLILGVTAFVGFLEAVGVGVVVAIVLFVAQYSRINVIKYALSGANQHSNVDRPSQQRQILSQKGDQLQILKLQGYIFFGTANSILRLVQKRIDDVKTEPLRYILLDFRLVTGVDSSTMLSFAKIQQLLRRHHITLICTQVSPDIYHQIENHHLFEIDNVTLRIFPDIDRGVQWCEDRSLTAEGVDTEEKRHTLEMHFLSVFSKPFHLTDLLRYVNRKEVPAGTVLIQQGDLATDLYFIESGQVTVQLQLEGETELRLRTMGSGTIVGEVGMYLGEARSASVIAETNCVVHQLTANALLKMEEKNPESASAFHRYMVRLLAERLSKTDNTLQMLLG